MPRSAKKKTKPTFEDSEEEELANTDDTKERRKSTKATAKRTPGRSTKKRRRSDSPSEQEDVKISRTPRRSTKKAKKAQTKTNNDRTDNEKDASMEDIVEEEKTKTEPTTKKNGKRVPSSARASAPAVPPVNTLGVASQQHAPAQATDRDTSSSAQEEPESTTIAPPSRKKTVTTTAAATITTTTTTTTTSKANNATQSQTKPKETTAVENGTPGNQQEPPKEESLVVQWQRRASDSAAQLQETVKDWITQTGVLVEHEAESDEGPGRVYHIDWTLLQTKVQPKLQLSLVWWTLMCLVLIIRWPYAIHPFLSTAVDVSNGALRLYKGLLLSRTPVKNVQSYMDSSWNQEQKDQLVPLYQTEHDLTLQINHSVSEFHRLEEAMRQVRLALEQDLRELELETSGLHEQLALTDIVLNDAISRVGSSLGPLQAIVESGVDPYGAMDEELLESLGDDIRLVLDYSFVRDWDIPEGSCAAGGGSGSQYIERVKARAQEMKKKADESAGKIQNDEAFEEAMRGWIRNALIEHLPNYRRVLQDKVKPASQQTGASLETVKRVLEARVEVERADQTGRIDYASILNGAEVIFSGDRATSPSLVDRLPVLNRLAHLLSIRSYGFGPDAALTPTYPPTALGQCWAFQKDSSSKFSAFGTLSVKLSEPVAVEKVSIEHPPKERTGDEFTAIRTFRVFGFERPDASGARFDLGAYEYKKDGLPRQDFTVPSFVRGREVPKLQSISIAIDSTWSPDYACLYRMRVLGKQPKA